MAVTLDYAQQVEARINQLLREGNIAAARMQLGNIAQGDNGPGVRNVYNRMLEAITAAERYAQQVQDSQRQQQAPPPPPGGGGGGSDFSAERAFYEQQLKEQREAASAYIKGQLEMYGLGSLAGAIDGLVREFGTSPDVIMGKIRQTNEYRDRFKGLLALQQKGINDVRNEAQYIELESDYRGVFRDAGIQDFRGTAGSAAERDAIARIVGDFSLSVNEVRDRVTDAQRVVADTPQEVRESLQRYYNVDPATLTAYVLDPQRTSRQIQTLANAAIVGGFGQKTGLDFGVGVSERIGEALGGERDITGEQIQPILTQVAETQKKTGRLAELERGTLTAEETALAQLDLDTASREKVRGLQSRERARFGGTSGVVSGSLARTPSI